jgi:hypothetical protein
VTGGGTGSTAGSTPTAPRPRRRRRPPSPRVVALVPAHEEEDTIASAVRALLAVERVTEVVVLADGCSDRTAGDAHDAGARVLAAPRRAGKGGAVDAALDRVEPADVYLLVDGDVGSTAAAAARLLDAVLAGEADLAVARFPALGGGGFGLVKRTAGWWIRSLGGFEPAEPLSGQRAVTRQALLACRPLARGFGLETAMSIDAARLGLRIVEVTVEMSHRATGRGLAGFVHRGRQGAEILSAVLPRALGLR